MDFDGDGHLDIILGAIKVPGFTPMQLRAYRNDGEGRFSDATRTVVPAETVGRGWMGGYGSGRPGYRPKVEELKRLDLVLLRRRGYLSGFPANLSWSCGEEPAGSIGLQAKSDGVRLFYRTRRDDAEWHDIDETVPTEWTPTRFGGRRQWFICLTCARRCRILYGGTRFRCRRCSRLSYSSQAESRADRANRAMFKIVRRLDPTQDFNELPPKPKGMHWQTYNRLDDRYGLTLTAEDFLIIT